jgi:DNA-binding MarR family transcriptional regulator
MLDDLLGYAIRRAQLAVFEAFARAMAGTGATPPLFAALSRVVERPGLSQSALAALMGIGRSAVVPLLDTLEAAGLIQRRIVAGDARRHGLHATAAGLRRHAAWARRVRAHDAALAAGLSEAERATLRALLARVEQASRERHTTAA